MKDILSILDLSSDEFRSILAESAVMKKRYRDGVVDTIYAGKTVGMYFEKPSLRTRVSVECAMNSLGGSGLALQGDGPNCFWAREAVKDQARVMSRYVSIITMRTFSQAVIEEFAREASVPVVNVLSDEGHPTQAMADLLTMQEEFGDDLSGRTLTYVGDGNNVARSLAEACAYLGVRFVCSSPDGYRLDADFIARVKAKTPAFDFVQEADPRKAVAEADAVYTDVWASMGQEQEAAKREKDFAAYQINGALMAAAPKSAIVLHCLPAHRGVEITDDVVDGPQSRVYDQAENRMHVYRGIFSLLAGDWRK